MISRRTVLIICTVFIAFSFVYMLTSCSSRTSQFELQGIYLAQNEITSPYFRFDQDGREWHTGQGRAYDHSLYGEYKIKGDTIVCRSSKTSSRNLSIELELIGNDKIKIVSIKDKDGVLDWLKEGDILTYYTDAP